MSCKLHLPEAVLEYHGKKMRLIFDADLEPRTLVIDSLPFQEGTFKLDLGGLKEDGNVIVAGRWKKVVGKPEE